MSFVLSQFCGVLCSCIRVHKQQYQVFNRWVKSDFELNNISCCACCTGESSFECTTEADSNTHDIKPRPYLCTVCHKRFTQKGSLNRHKPVHTGENSFVCTVCEKRFTQKEHLKVHKRTHFAEKLFVCTVCNKLLN